MFLMERRVGDEEKAPRTFPSAPAPRNLSIIQNHDALLQNHNQIHPHRPPSADSLPANRPMLSVSSGAIPMMPWPSSASCMLPGWASTMALPSSMTEYMVHASSTQDMVAFPGGGQLQFGMMHPSVRMHGSGFDMSGMHMQSMQHSQTGGGAYPFLSLPNLSSLIAAISSQSPGTPSTAAATGNFGVPHHNQGGFHMPMGYMAPPAHNVMHHSNMKPSATMFGGHEDMTSPSNNIASSPKDMLQGRGQPRRRGLERGAPQRPSVGHGPAGADIASEELTILPRRRAGQPEDMKRDPIVLTKKDLQELYGMRLSEAAAKLDISVTAMKAVCRKAGICKWPYRRIQFYKSRGMQFSADEVFTSGTKSRGASKRPAAAAAADAATGDGGAMQSSEGMDMALGGRDMASRTSSSEDGEDVGESSDDDMAGTEGGDDEDVDKIGGGSKAASGKQVVKSEGVDASTTSRTSSATLLAATATATAASGGAGAGGSGGGSVSGGGGGGSGGCMSRTPSGGSIDSILN